MEECLKVKAKSKATGKWIEGYYFNCPSVGSFIMDGTYSSEKGVNYPEMYEFENETLCFNVMSKWNGRIFYTNDKLSYLYNGVCYSGVIGMDPIKGYVVKSKRISGPRVSIEMVGWDKTYVHLLGEVLFNSMDLEYNGNVLDG